MLIGIPLTDPTFYIDYRAEVLEAIQKAICDVHHDVYVPYATKEEGREGIVEATNALVDHCLRGDWAYLWIVEGDVVVPPYAFEKLTRTDADIALGCYPFHYQPYTLMAGFLTETDSLTHPFKIHKLSLHEVRGKTLENMVWAGIGCALIKRRVLEAGLRFKHCTGDGHDLFFLFEAQMDYGFTVHLHGDVVCGHLPEWPRLKTGKESGKL